MDIKAKIYRRKNETLLDIVPKMIEELGGNHYDKIVEMEGKFKSTFCITKSFYLHVNLFANAIVNFTTYSPQEFYDDIFSEMEYSVYVGDCIKTLYQIQLRTIFGNEEAVLEGEIDKSLYLCILKDIFFNKDKIKTIKDYIFFTASTTHMVPKDKYEGAVKVYMETFKDYYKESQEYFSKKEKMSIVK